MITESGNFYMQIKGVSKEYPVPHINPLKKSERFSALKAVDLSVPRGSVSCILGPNGAGKTTLIKILAGLILPDDGEILISGEDRKKNVGLVTPNERAFYWRLTGRQNLEFFASLYNIKKSRKIIDSILFETGLEKDGDKPFRQYSAGMKQKLNIARALLSDPALYLLDEPANHLDPLAREQFRKFVKEILLEKRKATVILCTHDLEEAAELADSIALLNEGKILAQGDPQLLKERVSRESAFILTCRYAPENWIALYPGIITPLGENQLRIKAEEEEMNEMMADFFANGGSLSELIKEEPRLMDILKHFIGDKNA